MTEYPFKYGMEIIKLDDKRAKVHDNIIRGKLNTYEICIFDKEVPQECVDNLFELARNLITNSNLESKFLKSKNTNKIVLGLQ